MTDLLQNFDFSRDSLHILLIVDLVFLENLNGYFFASKCMLAKLDLPESSLAQMLSCIS